MPAHICAKMRESKAKRPNTDKIVEGKNRSEGFFSSQRSSSESLEVGSFGFILFYLSSA
jgi:hypothetical protein